MAPISRGRSALSMDGVGRSGSMRGLTALLVMAACVGSSGCITGFPHPLGPAREGFIEPDLVGTWTCQSAEGSKPGQVTFTDFDRRQYLVESVEDGKSAPKRLRAFATRIDEVPFLSVRDIGSDPDAEWTFLTYRLPDSGHLILRAVDPDPFEDVLEDAASVRERLAQHLEDPEVFLDLVSCTRVRIVSATS